MRIVVAPDKFAGTLSALEASAAIAEGWARRAPGDVLEQVPMSDGGPGFVDVLHAALGGDLLGVTVTNPYGEQVPATVLRVEDTAYVESAQAVGLHLTPREQRQPERGTSRGVGELLLAAVGSGARRIVVGLGGSATNDGGAGVLAALGATATGAELDAGPGALDGITAVDLAPAREALAGVELVAASDVDNPLAGLLGATKNYGPQKGLPEERLLVVDGWLEQLGIAADRHTAAAKGAGAAGGIGFALLLLGAVREPGVEMVAAAVGLADRIRGADLVLTGEGAFDFSSRSGKVPYGVAQLCAEGAVPCVALAGKVLIGSREMRTLGVESAYSLVDLVGEERAFDDPAGSLARLAERTARTWSR
jgi:glycerate kinase